MNRDSRFLRKEYLKNLFPVLFSVLGGTINTLIDSVFVSGKLGSLGLAAVNLSMPVYLLICTFGGLLGGGASVMSSQAAGKEDMKKAAEYYHTAIMICLLLDFAAMTMGCIGCGWISRMLSQGGDSYSYVYDYCMITILGMIPSTLFYMPLYYLQLEGKTCSLTNVMVLMIAGDVFLDYLLMFVFDFGIHGAAAASVISTAIACFYGFIQLEGGYSNYHFRLIKPDIHISREIIRYGSPSALGNFVDAVRLLLLNALILHGGGASAAAVWAVLNSLSEFSVSITSGVPRAAAPLTGAYSASRENSGLRILTGLQVRTGLLLSAGYAAMLLIFARMFEHMFSIGQSLFVPLACLGVFVVLDVVSSIWTMFFHSTGRILLSNLFVIFRKLIVPILTAVLLIAAKEYLWLFLPVGGIFTLFISGIIVNAVYHKYKNTDRPLSKILLLNDLLEREKKVLDFSITPDAAAICTASEQIKDFCIQNQMGKKQTMKLQLSIEELLTVIAQKNPHLDSVDLRAFAIDNTAGIRIRCAGQLYNPFSPEAQKDEDFMMGILMLAKMAETVSYTYTLGMNIINIMFAINERNNS